MSTSPSTSPPRTPDERLASHSKPSSTPNSDDSSVIDDLSFDYVLDGEGNFIRLSKGSSSKSNQSSPPTPQEAPLQPDLPPTLKPPSSPLDLPISRISLSRSESAFPVLTGVTAALQNDKPTRSFHRVASGPALSGMGSYLAPTTSSSKPRTIPRRVTMEEHSDRPEANAASRLRQTLESNTYTLQDEKENISEPDENPYAPSTGNKRRHSPPLTARSVPSSRAPRTVYSSSTGGRPLAEVPVPQRGSHARQILPGPNRAGRIMKSSSKYGATSASAAPFDRISEHGGSESEQAPGDGDYPPIGIALGGDDTDPEDEPVHLVEPASVPLPSSIPATSQVGSARLRSHLSVNVNIASSVSNALVQSGSARPRRSASLSDALNHDDYQLQLQQQFQNPHSRPGTSSGMNGGGDNTAGARRVTPEEKERMGKEMESEYERYRREAENADRREHDNHHMPSRQSPSPTHNLQNQHQGQRAYGHRRRDSDTLRSLAPSISTTALGSPTVMDMPPRPSPTAATRLQGRWSPPESKGRVSPPTTKGRVSPITTKGRVSPPTAKGRVSPPTARGRLSPSTGGRTGKDVAKHRRSPTAPEPSTTSGMIGSTSSSVTAAKTWAIGEKEDEYEYGGAASSGERERERDRDRERDKDRERERRVHQSQASLQQQQQYAQQAAPAPAPAQLNRHIVVNKKAYARLDMIGKGGSSRVFRVLNHANELYAIKRVSLDKTDSETMSGYMNEIALLKRLEGNSRIIRLIDSEVKAGPGGSKGHLLLVMECGEIDLARLLQEQMKEPVNMVWVSYYWQQMLQAVHVIHEEKIVHSDLKPANFVLVRGQLKLIDFGIANAIANDTTNIQRDHQIGTVNYMSPEAIELPDGMRRLKVGRPSDVWSLGCILYQMIYGQPPFQHLSVYQKMKAIPDLAHVIEFPEYATPCVPPPRTSSSGGNQVVEPPKKLDHLKRKVRVDVIAGMKSCLCRNPKERATIPELLDQDWLAMKEPDAPPTKQPLAADETVINPYYMRQLLQYGIKLGESQNTAMDPESLLREAERLVAELKSIQP